MKTPTVIIIGLLIVSIAFLIRNRQRLEREVFAAQIYIQTPQELQQRLKDTNDPRYDPGEIDGIIGPNTIHAWNNWLNDKDAEPYFWELKEELKGIKKCEK